jgi:hypothetical protein
MAQMTLWILLIVCALSRALAFKENDFKVSFFCQHVGCVDRSCQPHTAHVYANHPTYHPLALPRASQELIVYCCAVLLNCGDTTCFCRSVATLRFVTLSCHMHTIHLHGGLQKCKDSGFCKRLRGVEAGNYTVLPGSGAVQLPRPLQKTNGDIYTQSHTARRCGHRTAWLCCLIQYAWQVCAVTCKLNAT